MRYPIFTLVSLFVLVASVAVAEPPSYAPSPVAPAPAPKADAAASLGEFETVMRNAGCQPQAIADPQFVADAKNAIRPVIHEEDASAMLTNKKHVVMAYGALLALLTVFLVVLAMRQRRLSSEIERLSDALERAIKDE